MSTLRPHAVLWMLKSLAEAKGERAISTVRALLRRQCSRRRKEHTAGLNWRWPVRRIAGYVVDLALMDEKAQAPDPETNADAPGKDGGSCRNPNSPLQTQLHRLPCGDP